MSNDEYDARMEAKRRWWQTLNQVEINLYENPALNIIALAWAEQYIAHLEGILGEMESVVVGLTPTVKANEFHLDE